MIQKLKPLYIFILLLFTIKGWSQKTKQVQVRDLESWSSLSLKWEPTKRLSFEVEEQFRLKEDASTTDLYFTELSSNYDLTKHIGIGFGMRHITENDNQGKKQGFDNFFRYQMDLSYKHKISRLSLKYRVRYQNKNELGISTDEGDIPVSHVRFRTSLGYNIKGTKWSPNIEGEIFRKYETGQPSEYNKYRITTGLSYDFKKYGEITLFYRLEKELNQLYPKTSNIIGFTYGYTIKSYKNSKKEKEGTITPP